MQYEICYYLNMPNVYTLFLQKRQEFYLENRKFDVWMYKGETVIFLSEFTLTRGHGSDNSTMA